MVVLQSGIRFLTICAIQLLDQTSFDGIWNPLVCLLLAFRWQCVRGVFLTYSSYTNVHLLTTVNVQNFVLPPLTDSSIGVLLTKWDNRLTGKLVKFTLFVVLVWIIYSVCATECICVYNMWCVVNTIVCLSKCWSWIVFYLMISTLLAH